MLYPLIIVEVVRHVLYPLIIVEVVRHVLYPLIIVELVVLYPHVMCCTL